MTVEISLILLSILAGFLLGIVSGLIPGIHTNNFALILVGVSPILLNQGIEPLYVAIIVLSNSISHTFHDIIPAIFLGAPNDDMALAVLPGHRLLLDGYGAEAVRLSALGSAGSVAFALIMAYPLVFFFTNAYDTIQENMAWILIAISAILILTEKGEYVTGQGSLASFRYKGYALCLFILSGLLGYFAFEMEYLATPILKFGETSILLPILSGLFGASQLAISLMSDSHIPSENISRMQLSVKRILRGIISGSFAGSIVAWLPGISASIATVVARFTIPKEIDRDDIEDELEDSKEFIVSISGVNTANSIFGLFALAMIGKTRSGAMVAVNRLLDSATIDSRSIILFLTAIVAAALLSYLSTIAIGNNVHHVLKKIEYKNLCFAVIAGLTIMVALFTGIFGILLFLTATTIGMLPPFMKVRRSHLMGVILLPVILYFI
ncbi:MULTISPECIES: tripartite tricarboxylate transporter permease [Methanohalophilus]|jgi:putative membrane protein|nr:MULTISPECIES: tripartite tricarboxylate transporter permease [Methanohalophilus]KXS41125.1 MAG: putative membrane protein [Methanohalophilus sp. T328-1]PQV43716.1 putative membrane protein [Methanohalophilus euhalobius]RXG34641.1 hypothetical protein CI957_694 [Methanohalophilus sp. WG1-DM]